MTIYLATANFGIQHFVLLVPTVFLIKGLCYIFLPAYFSLSPFFRSEIMSAKKVLEHLGISAKRNLERLENLGIVSILMCNFQVLLLELDLLLNNLKRNEIF